MCIVKQKRTKNLKPKKMYIRDEITIKVDLFKEITLMYSVITESQEWDIINETIEVNEQPYTPTSEEWIIIKQKTEIQAKKEFEQYEKENTVFSH